MFPRKTLAKKMFFEKYSNKIFGATIFVEKNPEDKNFGLMNFFEKNFGFLEILPFWLNVWVKKWDNFEKKFENFPVLFLVLKKKAK